MSSIFTKEFLLAVAILILVFAIPIYFFGPHGLWVGLLICLALGAAGGDDGY